jgi:hypothetical protein
LYIISGRIFNADLAEISYQGFPGRTWGKGMLVPAVNSAVGKPGDAGDSKDNEKTRVGDWEIHLRQHMPTMRLRGIVEQLLYWRYLSSD